MYQAVNWPKRDAGRFGQPASNKMMDVSKIDNYVWVTGQTTDDQGRVVIATWRTAPDPGNPQTNFWRRTWSPADDSPPLPYGKAWGVAVVTDASGGAFVVGTYGTPSQGTDVVLLYYQADGTRIQIPGGTFNGTGSGDDYAVALTVDNHNNAWVGAVTQGTGTGADYLVWGVTVGGPLPNGMDTYDHAGKSDLLVDIKTKYAVITDPTQQVEDYAGIAVTGTSWDLTNKEDIQTLYYVYNYDNATFMRRSLPLSRFRYVTPGSDTATSLDMLIPTNGVDVPPIFVSGNTPGLNGTTRMVTLGYSVDLIGTNWMPQFYSAPSGSAYSTKLVVGLPIDNDGTPFVYHLGSDNSSGSHAVVVTYRKDSVIRWTYNSPISQSETPADIATNDNGSVYVAETIVSTTYNYRTFRLYSGFTPPPPGRLSWNNSAIEYDSNGSDWAAAIRLTGGTAPTLPGFYVTGSSLSLTDETQKYATVGYYQQ